jgi:hypothetical protein
MNSDITQCTEEGSKNHYTMYGYFERRQYKHKTTLPTDFEWGRYVSINKDLQEAGITTEEYAKYHYLVYGIHEKRTYNSLPGDFEWREYLSCNLDVLEAGITTKEGAVKHYLTYGISDERNYKKIKVNDLYDLNKKNIYIVCENNTGGSWKYLVDIMNNYNNYNYIFLNTKESLKKIKRESLIVIQYLFNVEFHINELIEIIQSSKLRLVIPLHDFYWFDINKPNQHNKYLSSNISVNKQIIQFFDIAQKVVCPSEFVYKEYSKYFNTSKFIIVPHNDYPLTIGPPIVPKINNTINIGIFNDYSIYKGKESYNYLTEKVKIHNGKVVNYMIVGKNIPRYSECEFYDFVKYYNIHAFLLLNKWGETYCYTLTKILNSGLPIFYNNIGAFKERIPRNDHYFINLENENQCNTSLKDNFCTFLDHIIDKNGDSYKNITDFTLKYNPYYNTLLHNYKNVVIITSKIIVSSNKLDYIHYRSIYTADQRYSDTLKTIQSIKTHIPGAYIILVDNSTLPNEQSIVLKKEVGHFLNINNEEYSYYTDKSEYKGFGEIYQTILALKYIQDNNIQYESLFKISGRYFLNDSFNINKYHTSTFVFKKNESLSDRNYYYTSFYKMGNNLQNYIQILQKILHIKNFDKYNNFKDLEVILPRELKDNGIKYDTIPILGITQNISVWNDKSNI